MNQEGTAPVFKQILICSCLVFLSQSAWSQRVTDASQQKIDWSQVIDEHLNLYSLRVERRDRNEGALVRKDTLYIKLRQDLRSMNTEARNRFVCDATSWLLSGRLAESRGLPTIFNAYPQLNQAQLIVFSVNTSVKINAKGRYDQLRKLRRQLTLAISRKRLMQLDVKQARINLRKKQCNRVAEALVDEFWLDARQ